MSILEAILLAFVQVLTEFLPVSSSGHLSLVQQFLEIGQGHVFVFDVLIHLGTLIAIVLYFLDDIIAILVSAKQEADRDEYGPSLRLIGLLLLANVPAVIVGFTIKDEVEGMLHGGITPCVMFLVTAVVLYLTKYVDTEQAGYQLFSVPFWSGMLIGVAQAVAIVPGISRSGMTIGVALLLMLEREDAGTFSFLLSIPAILGATLLAVFDLPSIWALFQPAYLVGFIVSFLGGLAALKLLMWIVKKGQFYLFSYYLLVVGFAGISYFSLS